LTAPERGTTTRSANETGVAPIGPGRVALHVRALRLNAPSRTKAAPRRRARWRRRRC